MKVKVDIDTDSSTVGGGKTGVSVLVDKIGLVSSIDLDPDLKVAFLVGADLDDVDFGQGDNNKYDATKIKTAKKNHVNGGCKVIAVVGGLFAFKAIWDDTQDVPWLALVGSTPSGNLKECRGGVSLDSYRHNLARRNYLNASGINDQNIFLYTNKNSEMHAGEKAAWASNGTFFESAAGGSGGNNDATKFSMDFTAAPLSTALGLIVSDDPFFRANRGELIKQVNTWLMADANRQVIYPSQIYASGVDLLGTGQMPKGQQSTLYGPDLKAAFLLFGKLAKYCLDHRTVKFGFFSVPPLVIPL